MIYSNRYNLANFAITYKEVEDYEEDIPTLEEEEKAHTRLFKEKEDGKREKNPGKKKKKRKEATLSLKKYGFPKSNRLYQNSDIKDIIHEGGVSVTPNFVMFYKKNDQDKRRFGVTCKRKFGNAVQRNRLKRYAREFFRLNKERFPHGTDVFIMPRKKLASNFRGKGFAEIAKEIERVLSGCQL